ncbi:MAG: NAD(P)-dependent oxidoreductase [Sphingomicrobium sp.]
MTPVVLAAGNPRPPLQLWGGVECTMVRVGDDWRDQLAETGHADRPGDLDEVAALRIKTLRYPILWEKVAPNSPHSLDFSWHDERLERLRELGIRVVGGLVHHGSGPDWTGFDDSDWGKKLGDYAACVAERYPWIEDWIPVNEPLTTARFACLYGHWHPHAKQMSVTLRTLVTECEGISAAMHAIRAVTPGAKLVVTEDFGRVFSTPALAYQAAHENERRWLSLDLLTGRVGPNHPFWGWLLNDGVARASLDHFRDGHAAPDVIGVDHYLTSERFLDDRLDRHPDVVPGNNGRDRYADVEAVRMPGLEGAVGPAARLTEVWDRYRIPLVVGDVHHGCTREEQARWFADVWRQAEHVREAGVDVRAVTLWALFGAVDWRSLLTRRDGHYEAGAFDIRSGTPQRTLVGELAAQLTSRGKLDHPVLDQPGWWQRPGRFYGAVATHDERLPGRTLLITGATGTLGQAFARICHHRGLAWRLTTRVELDITDSTSIAAAIDRERPWAVINAAGFVRTWEADANIDECFSINALGAEQLARACRIAGLPFVTFSSDLVFDGQLGRPYLEADPVSPQGAYGRSKAEAEARVLATNADSLVVRTSAFFGPWDRHNFLVHIIDRLKRGEHIDDVGEHAMVSPTYVPDLVHATLDLLLDRATGIRHLANSGEVSWHDLARDIATRTGHDPRQIHPSGAAPSNTSLTSGHGTLLRPLDRALDDFVRHSRPLAEMV